LAEKAVYLQSDTLAKCSQIGGLPLVKRRPPVWRLFSCLVVLLLTYGCKDTNYFGTTCKMWLFMVII